MPIQTAIDSISQNQGSPFGFKNRIINGGMVIDQRNAGASGTSNDAYTVDRFQASGSQSAKWTWQQREALNSSASNYESGSAPSYFKNSLKFTSSSSYSVLTGDYFGCIQRIEGTNISDLGWGTSSAKTVTLSFWVRSSLTGTFGGSLKNSANDRSYPYTYTISQANTWEQKSITIPGETTGTWLTTNGIGIQVLFGLGVGTTYSAPSANSWQSANYWSVTGSTSVVGTNAATWYITGVQLEVGSQASSFDFRPYTTELALCQRYCYAQDNRSLARAYYNFGVGTYTGTTSAMVSVKFPVNMRIPPSSITTSAGTTFFIDPGVTNWTTTTIDQVSEVGGAFLISGGSGGQSAGYGGRALSNNTGLAYVIWNAEM